MHRDTAQNLLGASVSSPPQDTNTLPVPIQAPPLLCMKSPAVAGGAWLVPASTPALPSAPSVMAASNLPHTPTDQAGHLAECDNQQHQENSMDEQ